MEKSCGNCGTDNILACNSDRCIGFSNWEPKEDKMADKFACRLHPQGRCSSACNHEWDWASWKGKEVYTSNTDHQFTVCPWPSRQKDAPKQRTNLEVAVEACNMDIPSTTKERVIEMLRAVGIDPDAICEKEAK